ncbi:beta-N-acetylhexosaminidase [uncultured Flavobacterium sp.]|uniref:beta-N-acetylhexosaminidase n=1 Tax=uncultured Flavobacterium sp. TaxID=165435 RepID=UPI0025DFD1F9|nr:beta-N-acetylhexosaminidase [uncultured Flavobacterium sp.]
MKKYLMLLTCALFFSCVKPYKKNQNQESDFKIIPRPVSLNLLEGKFSIDSGTKIAGTSDLENEGNYLASILSDVTGKNIPFEIKGAGNIELKIDGTIKEEEGYMLSVTSDKVLIVGNNAAGVFYGIQTFRQLLPVFDQTTLKNASKLEIHAITIKDRPRFPYRGMHLDVGRHMFPVAFIKKYIDLIAMHKMNKLHWHLTEDQGWRIEIKKYPKLTETGSKRYGTITGLLNKETGNDQTQYGGYYTQEEVKEIVKYATDRHITVIPEIELPGHASAAIASYPFLSCFPDEPTFVSNNMGSSAGKEAQHNGTPKIVQETWGVFDDVFCAGNEKTFEFLEDVLDEVIPLFPSEYIHIGGDECPKSNWKRCPACQKRIKDNNLIDEHGLQSYFIQRMEKYLNSKGKKIIGWDEILEGGLAPNATVMSWRGEKGGIEAAKQHHDVIMTPGGYCYFDKYQTDKEDHIDEPLAIGGFISVEKVYNYDPVPDVLSSDEKKYILGAQGNVWTEYITSPSQLEYMILPRMSALSEVVWTSRENKNWNDFKNRLDVMRKRYDALGLNYAKHVFGNQKIVKQ